MQRFTIAAREPGGDAPQPDQPLNAATIGNARGVALVVGIAALVFWPLDHVLFEDRVVEAFTIWRTAIATLSLVVYLALGRRGSSSGGADLVVILVALSAGAASCGLSFARAGALNEPWFHACYLLPLTTVPLLLPLFARLLVSTCVVGVFVAVYFATVPAQLASPALSGVMSFLGFATIAGVAVGHMVYRVTLADLAHRQRLAADAVRLEQLSRAKSELLANVSHELRTPLTLIIASLRELQGVTVVDRDAVDTGLRNAARLLLLIDDLLELSRLQAGGGRLRLELVDVVRLVNDVARAFTMNGPPAVEVETPEVLARVDPARVATATYNLLSNAFKFTDAGRREVRIRVRADVEQVRIEVADNGIGIRPEHVGRVFERFEQEPADAGGRRGGVGIGLALVRDIARAHGGRVDVVSVPGVGSRFALVLPRQLADAGAESRAEPGGVPEEQGELFALARERALDAGNDPADGRSAALILVVEDDPDLRRLLVRTLRRSHRVIAAEGGAAALALARARCPDLIVTDIMMPTVSGLDLIREVRRERALARIPALVLTAITGPEPRREVFAAGAEDFLTKPFEAAELVARVDNLLALRKQEQALTAANHRLEQRVLERTAQLRRLAAHLERCREDERRHLARELHDEMAQLLTALRFELAHVKPHLAASPAEARQSADRIDNLLDQTIDMVRRIVTALRPPVLDQLGIAAAVDWWVDEFARRTGLRCEVQTSAAPEPRGEAATVLFRVLQEALTNVARHADARHVSVALCATADRASILVADDGRGFDVGERVSAGMGLLGMGERARNLGGHLTIQSGAGTGTTCRVELPLQAAELTA